MEIFMYNPNDKIEKYQFNSYTHSSNSCSTCSRCNHLKTTPDKVYLDKNDRVLFTNNEIEKYDYNKENSQSFSNLNFKYKRRKSNQVILNSENLCLLSFLSQIICEFGRKVKYVRCMKMQDHFCLSAIFLAVIIILLGIPDTANAGACWMKLMEGGKCNELYSKNITKEECCKRGQNFGFTEKDLSDVEYFFATAIGGGANCVPCLGSCETAKCGPGKRCVVRKSRPRCICAPYCKSSKEKTQRNNPIRVIDVPRNQILAPLDFSILTSNSFGNNSHNGIYSRQKRQSEIFQWDNRKSNETDTMSELEVKLINQRNSNLAKKRRQNETLENENIDSVIIDTLLNVSKSNKIKIAAEGINLNDVKTPNNSVRRNNFANSGGGSKHVILIQDNKHFDNDDDRPGQLQLDPNVQQQQHSRRHHYKKDRKFKEQKFNNNNRNTTSRRRDHHRDWRRRFDGDQSQKKDLNPNSKSNPNRNANHKNQRQNQNPKKSSSIGNNGNSTNRNSRISLDEKIRDGYFSHGFPYPVTDLTKAVQGPYYNPVCGNDGKTYKTECQLKKRACRQNTNSLTVAYRGHCQISCELVRCLNGLTCVEDQYRIPHCISCSITCPQDDLSVLDTSKAVCGVDGRTYKSVCDINRLICITGRSIPVAYSGPCQEKASCGSVHCGKREYCLNDLITQRPTCVSCSFKCPRKRRPQGHRYEEAKICANNNHTYNSWCQMRKDSCNTGYYIDFKHIGECHKDSVALNPALSNG